MSDSIRPASVTLGCLDTELLATFYAEITDGTITNLDEYWATVICPTGRMDFQRVVGYTPPIWPDPASSVQVHLEFYVEDRAAAELRVLKAGARKYEFQPNSEQCYVYADPAGHPLCLTTWVDMRPQTSGPAA
ncbi:VOC family protein [Micromonospora sp. NPDC023888]|uniref:VOC family protein n=1 Tax=Micromonospora sp. NPDC023888 TaxID=3155607 RepID=UPI0033E141F9